MKSKLYWAVIEGDKLPRKAKKSILGKRMSKSKLNKLLKKRKIRCRN